VVIRVLRLWLSTVVLGAFLLAGCSAQAEENESKRQLRSIADNIIVRLPMEKMIALRATSPENAGLPEDFLRKLASDLEAALLEASNFDIKLANRNTIEDLWSDAIEFNNADFEKLYAASKADILLMLSARAIPSGVEINLTAYELSGEEVGRVIAASGSILIALDMEANIGVDVKSLNEQMKQVLGEIEKFAQSGGLIAKPATYAEFYHNARVLQQRGEDDLALANYESALKKNIKFVDPLVDYLKLLNAKYGAESASKYVEKKLASQLDSDLNQVVDAILEDDHNRIVQRILSGEMKFPPALLYWTRRHAGPFGDNADISRAWGLSILIVMKSYKDGSLYEYFIDDLSISRLIEYLNGYFTMALENDAAVNIFKLTPEEAEMLKGLSK
jgi:hypothetical protein